MPQMSPLMWQMMFLISMLLLILSINKNYFSEIKPSSSSIASKGVNNLENTWSW